MTDVRIYTASKTRHAPMWLARRAAGAPIISTWIDQAGPGDSPSMSDLWIRCVREASTATALIVYAEEGDVLKGGFVEVGAALGNGVPVFVVGAQSGWSFVNHPLVTECDSVDDAVRGAMSEDAVQQLNNQCIDLLRRVKAAIGSAEPYCRDPNDEDKLLYRREGADEGALIAIAKEIKHVNV